KYIALTIDDGLCRPGNGGGGDEDVQQSNSMVQEVCQLLEKYQQAKATFFVCTEYTSAEDAAVLLSQGHELGNHLRRDVSGFYCNLSRENFEQELIETNQHLEQILESCSEKNQRQQNQVKWFRAPQGRMSVAMKEVLKEHGMVNVMGDSYCDDWCFMEALNATDDAEKINQETERVANLMTRQLQSGSIAIFHMPQRGFREAGLLALEKLLQQCQQQDIRCVTVSQLVELSRSTTMEATIQRIGRLETKMQNTLIEQ
ncbi:MAG: hypothetical protein SGILL_003796, partial [Bacillariaceae sp.]